MKSILQDEKKCYVTGAANVPLHKHHIYGGPNRGISEANGFYVYLTPKWHNMSNVGVHFNRVLDEKLKKDCQRKFEETHTRAEFMALIGRDYL